MPPGRLRITGNRSVEEAKVYYPTWDEFKDFNKFMQKVELDGVVESGIIKVVPPKEWVPRKAGYELETLNYNIARPITQKFTPVSFCKKFQSKNSFLIQSFRLFFLRR